MRRWILAVMTVLVTVVAASAVAGAVEARSPEKEKMKRYAACAGDEDRIQADELPRVVDQDRCPVAGRVIVDDGVKSELPEPGTGIFSESIYPDGAQELVVNNPEGDTFTIKETGATPPQTQDARASTQAFSEEAPDGCGVPRAYSHYEFRVYGTMPWSYNARSTPAYLSVDEVEQELRLAGVNITNVRDACGIPDEVGSGLRYESKTTQITDITDDGTCPREQDGESVIAFGTLPEALGRHCGTYDLGSDGGVRITSSDIKINKANFKWTTEVTPECSNEWDIRGLVTHERGHTFGMGHTDEASYPYQTMSPELTGPCEILEQSLGAGDATGLNRKYQ